MSGSEVLRGGRHRLWANYAGFIIQVLRAYNGARLSKILQSLFAVVSILVRRGGKPGNLAFHPKVKVSMNTLCRLMPLLNKRNH